jgi:arginine decarboxylase
MYTRAKYPVVIVDPTWDEDSFASQRIRAIAEELQQLGYPTHATHDVEDGKALIEANPNLGCLLVAWDPNGPEEVRQLIRAARSHGEYLPVFLLADRTEVRDIDLLVVEQIDEYIWKLEDPATFVAGRVTSAIEKYANILLPPFFGAMVRFAEEYEYSWHTPGHCGGTAYLKSAVGQEFVRFFGEQLFRSDLSVSVSDMGSLLKHSGPVGKAERNAAVVFGSDMTYFVTSGSSASNRIVFQASVIGGDSVVVDRNCHKSVEQAILLTGCLPTYLLADSNNYGIIGPIPPHRLGWPEVIERIQTNPHLGANHKPNEAELLVITNSTYDGLCYDVRQILAQIDGGARRIHFDEAWYAYARFNPMYEDRYAMAIRVDDESSPTIFSTQSTHKLLAALSQASMIHVKSSRRAPVEHDRFNEAYMMHSSTSPQYAIIASNDIAAAMMSGGMGKVLTQESIDEAVAFRQVMARLERDRREKRDWWFRVWQPDKVRTPRGVVRFEDADSETLATHPECWTLEPGATWHGFKGLTPGYCLLDPIKVTLITPGIAPNGSLLDPSIPPIAPDLPAQAFIPGPVVSAFLDSEGIVAEKTGHYTVLFLFSLGITKGKWGTLVSALFEFKHLYDTSAPLGEAIPSLVEYYPDRYSATMTLRDLCQEMHACLRELELCQKERALRAVDHQPIQRTTPYDAYRALVKNQVQRVPVDRLEGRVVAVGLVPYPPGIPVLMPGEEANAAVCDYLQGLEEFDDRFPGFEHEIHGIGAPSEAGGEGRPGGNRYWVYCLPEKRAKRRRPRRPRTQPQPRG